MLLAAPSPTSGEVFESSAGFSANTDADFPNQTSLGITHYEIIFSLIIFHQDSEYPDLLIPISQKHA